MIFHGETESFPIFLSSVCMFFINFAINKSKNCTVKLLFADIYLCNIKKKKNPNEYEKTIISLLFPLFCPCRMLCTEKVFHVRRRIL